MGGRERGRGSANYTYEICMRLRLIMKSTQIELYANWPQVSPVNRVSVYCCWQLLRLFCLLSVLFAKHCISRLFLSNSQLNFKAPAYPPEIERRQSKQLHIYSTCLYISIVIGSRWGHGVSYRYRALMWLMRSQFVAGWLLSRRQALMHSLSVSLSRVRIENWKIMAAAGVETGKSDK